jgi:hypothetical protein
MDPALRPRPVSSVAVAYLSNALQLNNSIERRHFYNASDIYIIVYSLYYYYYDGQAVEETERGGIALFKIGYIWL